MAKVYLKKTKPTSILKDYQLLLKTVSRSKLNNQRPIIIKLNLSWTKFYPACSTPPLQLEGVIKGLLDLGFSSK